MIYRLVDAGIFAENLPNLKVTYITLLRYVVAK